ncbi:MAG: DUF1465 family protein [Pseudomonadota bacterium]
MNRTTSLSRPIIEALYTEALILADEVRAEFAQGSATLPQSAGSALHIADHGSATPALLPHEAMARLALSTEGLKTTTRMMHVLAWLLNQRAFFSGELTAKQVLRHGALPDDRVSDSDQVELLGPDTRALIAETERLHSRIARLDQAWRQGFDMGSPVRAFQRRIGQELGGI